ncbi:MAG: hypothetical protein HKM24_06485, partial [Gammaproteobacteria bacterium]|nr:hypothetical protein [Gammaproteobacteria bacterium]
FQIADGLHIIPTSALRGYKDTKIPALINFFAYAVVTAPLIYWGIYVAGFGLLWIWWCLVAAQFACFLLQGWRLQSVSNCYRQAATKNVALAYS